MHPELREMPINGNCVSVDNCTSREENMNMNKIQGFPPNYEEIKKFFPTSIYTIYTWGENLYVHPLNDLEILPDVELHESIHSKQQKDPVLWWRRYLVDPKFRLEQEVEAYAKQYAFIVKNVPTKLHKEYLFAYASDLASDMYGLGKSYAQMENLIRLTAKGVLLLEKHAGGH